MGIPMTENERVPQAVLSDSQMYDGIMRAFFGEKKKFESEEKIPCIKVRIELVDCPLKNKDGGNVLDDDGQVVNRFGYIDNFTISCGKKSNLYKWHKAYFKEELTVDLWNTKYAEGDKWVEAIDGVKVKCMMSVPGDNDFQAVDKIIGFAPIPF
jgi:hypothetical protein